MKTIAFAVVTALSLTTLAAAQNAPARPGVTLEKKAMSPSLNDLAVAPAIVDKQPEGAADRHPTDVGSLYCWSSIKNTGEATTVKHVWKHKDVVLSEIPREVRKSSRWRTWSKLRINTKRTGDWSCEVVAEDGTSLGKAQFTIQ